MIILCDIDHNNTNILQEIFL